MKDAKLILPDLHGIYLPQRFAQEVDRTLVRGVSSEDWEILEAGPDHDLYWEAWDDVTVNASILDPQTGVSHFLYQDGDLWAIPTDTEEEKEADTSAALAWLDF